MMLKAMLHTTERQTERGTESDIAQLACDDQFYSSSTNRYNKRLSINELLLCDKFRTFDPRNETLGFYLLFILHFPRLR